MQKLFCLSSSQITKLGGQVKIKIILKLISGTSRVVQKLLRYFNVLALLMLSNNSDLKLNGLESVMLSAGPSV